MNKLQELTDDNLTWHPVLSGYTFQIVAPPNFTIYSCHSRGRKTNLFQEQGEDL